MTTETITKEHAEISKLTREAERLAAESLKLASETGKIGAEKAKIEAELQKIQQEVQGLKSTRSKLTTIATIFRDVSVIIGVLVTAVAVWSGVNSIKLAQDAERRLREASVSEMNARAVSTRIAFESEQRVRESTARELEIRTLATFMADILPRIGGSSSPRVIEQCISAHAGEIEHGKTAQQIVTMCTGHVPFPRTAQIGGYQAAIDFALRYPMLCSATQAALSHNAQYRDPEAGTALQRLGDCANQRQNR